METMHVFCGLLHIIVHVLAATQDTANNGVEKLNATEENCTMPLSSKIIGGTEVEPKEFAPIAALVTKRNNSVSGCTGTVLSNRYVLTAGHCITRALSITIYIDCKELYKCKEEKQGSGILHPRYGKNDNTIVNDVGLVRSRIPFSTSSYAYLATVTAYFQGCVVMGYGLTSENLRIMNKKLYMLEVLEVVPCTYVFPSVVDNPSINTMICTLTGGNRRYSFGDSGGPLICNNTQVGVTSQLLRFSERDGQRVEVMSWVPVSLHVEWILNVMSSSNCPRVTIQLVVLLLFLIYFTR